MRIMITPQQPQMFIASARGWIARVFNVSWQRAQDNPHAENDNRKNGQ
jgi:hypothetical protein